MVESAITLVFCAEPVDEKSAKKGISRYDKKDFK
jgi:hypothetical protein